MMSVSDTDRYLVMVQNQNPEVGMGHARAVIPPVSEDIRKYCEKLWSQYAGVVGEMDGYCQQKSPETGESVNGIDVPNFDSEAHRKFMRSLG